jgi:iron(III) transport system substrate-binding protein
LRRTSRLLTSLSVASCVIAVAACGSSHSSPATTTSGAPSGSITLYSGQHEQTTSKLVAAFTKATGIKVNVRSDDEAELGNQIIQEGSHSPADAFFTENTPVLEALREHGLLATLPASTLRHVPDRYSSPQGKWVGVSARVDVLVYNPSKIKQSALPDSLLELAEPRFKGKVAFAPSETDFQPLVSAITTLHGEAAAKRWLLGLKANGKVYPDNETVVAKVNSGQAATGIINHYYWYRLRDEVGKSGLHSALHYYAPGDVGNLLDVSGAAVLKSSHNPAAAQAFVAFLVGRTGQQVLAHSESYEYPIGSNTPVFKPLRPLSSLTPPTVSLSQLGDGSKPLALEQSLGLL